ncbi:MAG: Uncharacterized protein G01um101418_780 [Parcubacteria group bacterium Gr01-1014_18]|nr:MAG: Uncharacterized protein Greene041636_750 [Parcubacteria group bacterium Greene0416_36]TSC80145.1 MAG: Uncharacterized protein G01um101418_780 [Parcubacteria group bacterium Gr01-1014_18]TSC99359.1 MAG: Uncharacterized protein Greene101420_287 [Parcubacteria group bacterium Greene1014_20]TSD06804.1 MAG: Uncharacterized protein Greene07142_538 [Parcubacteria group bacterium Greene0714_2]
MPEAGIEKKLGIENREITGPENKAEQETKREQVLEAPESTVESSRKMENKVGDPKAVSFSVGKTAAAKKSGELVEIEKIMESDLSDYYQTMPKALQSRFKTRGEEVARAIDLMLRQAAVNAKKIVKLILGWLRMLPGVNRFFLEQEAKIKTDQILLYKEELDRRRLLSKNA